MPDDLDRRQYGHHLVDELLASRMSRRDVLRRASVVGIGIPALSALLNVRNAAGAAQLIPAASRRAQQVKAGGTLRVASSAPVAAVDPVTMYDGGSINVVQQVAEYLAWVNPDNTLRPVLASSWKPNAAGDVWTFQVRQGVKFSNGAPLTADDVVATFQRLVNPASGSSAATNFKGVLVSSGIQKTGEYEVTFALERPFVDFPYAVASTNYNAVVLPSSYAGDFAKSPIGTGPFILTAYETGVSATFKRNPNYWDAPKPYLDGVSFTFFNPDAVPAQEAALQTGAVDIYQSAPSTGSPLWHDPNIALPTLPSSYYGEFWFRTDTPPWTDARVRQAVAYALDRPAIISNIFAGRAALGNDEVFSPAFPGSPVLPQRGQDIAKAKQLLAAAGHPRGFSATLTTEGPGIFSQYATLVQSYVAQIGIDLSLNVESTSTFYGSGSDQPWLTVPVGIVDWAARATPEQLYQSAYTAGGIWNSSKWANAEFDKLSNEYEATVDQTSRSALAKQLATLQQEATPAVIAWWKDAVYSIWKKVHNLQPNGSYFLDLTTTWLE